jgi:hypothetical protein
MSMFVRQARRSLFAATGLVLGVFSVCLGGEPTLHPHLEQVKDACAERLLNETGGSLESVQVETSNIKTFEAFFGAVLKAPLVEHRDHPDKDSVRGYCYRGIRIIVRQEHAVPRPTGWVQINFTVSDVGIVQRELEVALKSSPVASLNEMERDKIVRVRLKPDVRRGDRKAIRLEVAGPEGFMIGFNQYKEEARQ